MLHTDDDQTKALPLELRLTAVTVHVRSGHWRKSPKRQLAPARFQSFQRRPFGDFQKPPRGGFFLLCGGLPASLPEKRRKPDTAAAFVGSARAHNGSTGPRRCCPMVGGTRPFAVVIPAQVVVTVTVALPSEVVIPAQAGIHACTCRRWWCRDFGLPAPRQPLPGVGSHWGGLR